MKFRLGKSMVTYHFDDSAKLVHFAKAKRIFIDIMLCYLCTKHTSLFLLAANLSLDIQLSCLTNFLTNLFSKYNIHYSKTSFALEIRSTLNLSPHNYLGYEFVNTWQILNRLAATGLGTETLDQTKVVRNMESSKWHRAKGHLKVLVVHSG